MADEEQSEVQRWTAKRRAALVISVLRGDTTAAEAARRHGLKVAEVEEWRERFLLGAEDALREEEINHGQLADLALERAVLAAVPPRLDAALAEHIQQLIERHPTFGYRRLWALLRFRQGIRVNRKALYRVLRLKGWLVHQRTATPRPRVQGLRSRAQRSDQRWAMDLTHVPCGADGLGHLTAVIDCHDREVTVTSLGGLLALGEALPLPPAQSHAVGFHLRWRWRPEKSWGTRPIAGL